MGIFLPILLIILSYLLGSIPWAVIISKKVKGIDIRNYGSKNMGATNVMRVLGKKWGILVFILDAMKAGIIILLFSTHILDWNGEAMILKIHPLVYGAIAYIGHLFPCFAHFKGGKGVSCAAGIIMCYNPLIGLVGLIAFIIVEILTHYVSLGSCVAVVCTTIAIAIQGLIIEQMDWIFLITCILLSILMIIRHIPNFKRLVQGTETKTYLFKHQENDKNKKKK